jgi:MFS transporter, DHA2 family, multidrug resistance protein
VAAQYPQYTTQITVAAKSSFLAGDQSAYLAGIIAVLIGAVLVFFVFPKRDEERQVLMEYHQEDMVAMGGTTLQSVTIPTKAGG